MTALKPPRDEELLLHSKRLVLEPLTVAHAAEMLPVISSPELYTFLPSDAPSLTSLRELYHRWTARLSPDGDEIWLNWSARQRNSRAFVGHFQAALDGNGIATIAYLVGSSYQRRGYAHEALSVVCGYLSNTLQANTVRAWIDTRNQASIAVARRLGMRQVGFVPRADRFKGSFSDEFVFELTAPPE